MALKKYLMWAGVAFVAFYLINEPTGAAGLIQNAATGLASMATSLSQFVNALA